MDSNVNSESSSIKGTAFKAEYVKALWDKLDSSEPYPKVSAVCLSYEDYLKTANCYIRSLLSRGILEGELETLIAVAEEMKGFTIVFSSAEYDVFVLKSTPEEEDKNLAEQLSKISWHGWNKAFGDNWKQYVR